MAKTSGSTPDGAAGPGLGPLERILAAMFVGIIVLSVVAFVVLMVGSASGWLDGPLYVLVFYIPFFGLPVALVLMVVLTILMAVRRSRANRQP